LTIVVPLNLCTGEAIIASEAQEIQNLRAFVKLYGYVKYFHPSDEASQIDWDKFAIYGTEEVKSAQDRDELKSALEELFLPIAPTIQIYHSNEKPRLFVLPEDTAGLTVVAWQHQGLGLKDSHYAYRSVRANSETRIFDVLPQMGELIRKELGGGLSCQIPLALYIDSRGMVRQDKPSFDAVLTQLDKIEIDTLTADNEFVRLGDIAIAWNTFQHFYPYFDVVGSDWDAVLTNALQEALADQNEREFYDTLRKFVAKLHDGHGRVRHKMFSERAGFPFLVDWIENHVVVIFSRDSSNSEVGDIIVSIDGVPAERILTNEEEYISGSPQWKRVMSLRRFGYGVEGTTAKLEIIRNGHTLKFEETRDNKERLSEPGRSHIEEIEEGIFYVNLDQAEMSEITESMDTLANAKGVIFDLRGYPNRNHEVIRHLLTKPDTSSAWMRVPQIIYPDQEHVVGFVDQGWYLQPQEPHIKGKAVFITDGRAISYAESFMGFIENYKLAEIVGQPTAGTNGNTNPFALPGGFRLSWTGMRVVKHDGTQHHLIGILPTVPAQRTIQGVIEGRDEFLEQALETLR